VAGNDRLDGGRGTDLVVAGSGNDVVRSRDGTHDRITCGPGRDRVAADAADRVGSDCEVVRRG
jgi:Ca2+-binding RTX toxin-like protein